MLVKWAVGRFHIIVGYSCPESWYSSYQLCPCNSIHFQLTNEYSWENINIFGLGPFLFLFNCPPSRFHIIVGYWWIVVFWFQGQLIKVVQTSSKQRVSTLKTWIAKMETSKQFDGELTVVKYRSCGIITDLGYFINIFIHMYLFCKYSLLTIHTI